MVNYTCYNCQKIFFKKSHFITHTENKKKPCVQKNTDSSELLQAPPDCSDFKMNNNKDLEPIDIKNIYKCTKCNSIFKKKFNLDRHLNGRCISKDDIKIKENNQVNIEELDIDDKTKTILSLLLNQNKKLIKELKEEMYLIKEENKEIKEKNKEITEKISKINKKKTINNNINTQNNQNNQLNTINNNVILAHGKEDLSKIDLETIMKCMSTIKHKEIIPSITKHVYLNDDKPENKNFCVVDMARNKCKYYNGKKWLVGRTTERIDKIFDSIHNVLTDPFEKDRINKTIEFIKANPKKFNEKWIKISNTYLKSLYDEDDKDNIENKLKVLEELKLIFFNNKDDIIKIKLE